MFTVRTAYQEYGEAQFLWMVPVGLGTYCHTTLVEYESSIVEAHPICHNHFTIQSVMYSAWCFSGSVMLYELFLSWSYFGFLQGEVLLQYLPSLMPSICLNLINNSQRLPLGSLPQVASFLTGFLELTVQIILTANRSHILFILISTGKISSSHCIALTGADLNAPKNLSKEVFWVFLTFIFLLTR